MAKKRYILHLIIMTSIALGLFLWRMNQSKQLITYPSFGIKIPTGYEIHGIDVSRYQKEIDWEQVVKMRDKGQKISFAIIKSTEGITLKDPKFDYNWKKSKENNIIRGSYFYFHVNRDPERQAQFFIENTKLIAGDLPPIIDIEKSHGMSADKIKEALKKCIYILEKKYNQKPIIYTGANFYETFLGNEFSNYPLWVAHYEQPYAPRINRNWSIWQHNEKGRVNGIRGHVDFNVFNGSHSALIALCL